MSIEPLTRDAGHAREVRTDDGLRLHVTVRGREDAPLTVVLAHCWAADEQDWHYQVHDLLVAYGHDVRIITWDQRGHGRSDTARSAACTIPHLARDLGHVVDAFAPSGPLVVAGHSIGGMTMCALPAERPDLVERMVGLLFVSTSSGGLDTVTLGLPRVTAPVVRHQLPRVLATRARRLSRSERRNSPLLERWVVDTFLFGQPRRPRDTGLVVDQLINCGPATMWGFFHDFMTHERTELLAAYADIPTVVLVGTRDLLTPPHHARRIAAHVRGAEVRVEHGAGHMLTLERPREVSAALHDLVDRALTDCTGDIA